MEYVRKPVERNAAAQMVDVVHTDTRRKPPENSRQVVVRATVQCGHLQIPFTVMLPERLLKLMLQVEQPHTD